MFFYADENFPLDVVQELRLSGHNVLTAFEDGRANQRVSDEEVLKRAAELKRTLVTLNRADFKKLHQLQTNHSGIVICTFDVDFAGQAQRIITACHKLSDLNNQLVKVYRPT